MIPWVAFLENCYNSASLTPRHQMLVGPCSTSPIAHLMSLLPWQWMSYVFLNVLKETPEWPRATLVRRWFWLRWKVFESGILGVYGILRIHPNTAAFQLPGMRMPQHYFLSDRHSTVTRNLPIGEMKIEKGYGERNVGHIARARRWSIHLFPLDELC